MKTALLVGLLVVSVLLVLAACSAPKSDAQVYDVPALVKNDVLEGEGQVAEPGMTVFVHYTGWLYDEAAPNKKGKKFDSSRDRGSEFNFPLGQGRVIRGWDEGVAGMKVGGQRTLIIPSSLGYGSRGAGGAIPGNSALVFDVELLGVR
ncbi:MAG: FKBP-type peptidyl-prolyl cis-trans isomerase [Gammaproteobacteria bacterium]|nr:FKBP-type peptidyl-prolyl cis-trans isomerase [Gammaproteobacteria bacterium]